MTTPTAKDPSPSGKSWLLRVPLPHTPAAFTRTEDGSIWIGFKRGYFVARYTRWGQFISAHQCPQSPRSLAAGPDNTLSILSTGRVNQWGERSTNALVHTIDSLGKTLDEFNLPKLARQHYVTNTGLRLALSHHVHAWRPGDQTTTSYGYCTEHSELALDAQGQPWFRNGGLISRIVENPPPPPKNPRNQYPYNNRNLSFFVNGWINADTITAIAPLSNTVWAAYSFTDTLNRRTSLRRLVERPIRETVGRWNAEVSLSKNKVTKLLATLDDGVWALCPGDYEIIRVSPSGRVIETRSLGGPQSKEGNLRGSKLEGLVLSKDEQTLYCLDVGRNELLIVDVALGLA